MNVEFYLSQEITINLKLHLWHENVKILSSFRQRFNGRLNITLKNLKTISVYFIAWCYITLKQHHMRNSNDFDDQL